MRRPVRLARRESRGAGCGESSRCNGCIARRSSVERYERDVVRVAADEPASRDDFLGQREQALELQVADIAGARDFDGPLDQRACGVAVAEQRRGVAVVDGGNHLVSEQRAPRVEQGNRAAARRDAAIRKAVAFGDHAGPLRPVEDDAVSLHFSADRREIVRGAFCGLRGRKRNHAAAASGAAAGAAIGVRASSSPNTA
jgi:hypothetical protein